MRRFRKPVAVLDYSKCHPEKCDKGACAAVEACPNKVIKQETLYEFPEIVQNMCIGCGDCSQVCPLEAIRMMR